MENRFWEQELAEASLRSTVHEGVRFTKQAPRERRFDQEESDFWRMESGGTGRHVTPEVTPFRRVPFGARAVPGGWRYPPPQMPGSGRSRAAVFFTR